MNNCSQICFINSKIHYNRYHGRIFTKDTNCKNCS